MVAVTSEGIEVYEGSVLEVAGKTLKRSSFNRFILSQSLDAGSDTCEI